MATSRALIDAISASTGETTATVAVALRRLREAKLIAVGGRGPYALAMTPRDAARLLIAICGAAPLERDSAILAVARFEPLPFSGEEQIGHSDTALREAGFAVPFAGLTEIDRFGDCLIKLLQGAKSRPWTSGYTLVKFFLPVPAVVIEHQIGAVAKRRWSFGPRAALEDLRYLGLVREQGLGQKTSIVAIDEHVLVEVAAAIS
jgi:hypothetical protein